IDIIAIITPAPGKADRVVELLNETAAWVKENEPGTLKYHLQRETSGESPQLIMIETYKDKAALGAHGSSAKFKALGATMKSESLTSAPMKVIFTNEAGGFASRL
ncbi:hypothetical protein EJ08DRAFT_553674, partial [Tothia fuscella]